MFEFHLKTPSGIDPIIQKVIALGDRNAKFLGCFPSSCFAREADRKRIITVATPAGALGGYLLYREARGRAVVQHLCIDESYRGLGLAKRLVDELRRRTAHLPYIMLHCAKEYDAYHAWTRLGFVPEGEKTGRGADCRPLTRFVLHNPSQTLYAGLDEERFESTLVAVLDLNIVIEMQNGEQGGGDRETLALRADWVQSEVSYWISSESYSEIDRNDDPTERERRKRYLHQFPQLQRDPEAERLIGEELRTHTGHTGSPQHESDLTQLAQACIGEADVFITRDETLLSHASAVQKRFGLDLLRPVDLLLRMDEVLRRSEYAPSRLEGSAIAGRRIAEAELADVADHFLNTGRGETKAAFSRSLREALAQGGRCWNIIVDDRTGPLAAIVALEEQSSAFTIRLLRVRPDALGETLTRHLLMLAIREGIARNSPYVDCVDPWPLRDLQPAWTALGFMPLGPGRARKWIPTGLKTTSALSTALSGLSSAEGEHWGDVLRVALASPASDTRDAVIERLVWPCRLCESEQPSFIVPIQPRHAMHLFDGALGEKELFGSDPSLVLNCENAYYRSAQAEVVTAPGRILWYVSADDGRNPVRQLRACSSVLATECGPAKELFKRNERLGVYRFDDVRAIAKGDIHGEVMCIRFGPTELFPHPIQRVRLDPVLKTHTGEVPPLSMPIRIPRACFDQLYRMANGIE